MAAVAADFSDKQPTMLVAYRAPAAVIELRHAYRCRNAPARSQANTMDSEDVERRPVFSAVEGDRQRPIARGEYRRRRGNTADC